LRFEAAKAAAPYVHARLQAVTLGGDPEHPIKVDHVSELESAWHNYDYSLSGDEFYHLCGAEYLARGDKNPQAITNLARLVATPQRLDEGYNQSIWMDADVFVFDQQNLVFDFAHDQPTVGYAFGREGWLYRAGSGKMRVTPPRVHNTATYFTQSAVDLDMLIGSIHHIDAHRKIVSNYQLGVGLLRGLQYSLMFPTFSHVCQFPPPLLRSLVQRNNKLMRL